MLCSSVLWIGFNADALTCIHYYCINSIVRVMRLNSAVKMNWHSQRSFHWNILRQGWGTEGQSTVCPQVGDFLV